MVEVMGAVALGALVTSDDQGNITKAELFVTTGGGIQKTSTSSGVVRTGPNALVELVRHVAAKLAE